VAYVNKSSDSNSQEGLEIPEPSDPTERIWRYMDLPKLIDMMESRRLFLCRADCFEDRHEGATLVEQKEAENERARQLGQAGLPEIFENFRKAQRGFTYISCWHRNNAESHAMWRIYCGRREGVAIQTTFLKLREAIDTEKFVAGVVSYGNTNLRMWNSLAPFFHKRNAFQYEQEVRVIADLRPIAQRSANGELVTPLPRGLRIPFGFPGVVENIFVHPEADDFFFVTVKSLISRYAPELAERVQMP
jgi:hypothetical protein